MSAPDLPVASHPTSRPSASTASDATVPSPHGRVHRRDIQGLRAVAVALVVGYHAGVPGLTGGYVGVDVFFVISGFLITRVLLAPVLATGRLDVAGFYAARARRILPAAVLVLAVTAVAFAALLPPLAHAALRTDLFSALVYVSNWHFAAASLVYGTQPSATPCLNFWSLSVEEQFYLVWPAVIGLAAWWAHRRAHGVARCCGIAFAVVLSASLAASVVLSPRSEPYSYYGLHTRAWELAVGGLLALLAPRLASGLGARAAGLLALAGLAAVVACATVFTNATVFPGYAALLPVLGGAAVLLAGSAGAAPSRWSPSGVLGSRPLHAVGGLSYSLYLWHWPCLVFAGTLLQPDHDTFVVARGWPAVAAVAVAVVLSVASYRLVENPLRVAAWMRRPRRGLTVGLAGMLVAAAVVAAALPPSQGAITQAVTTPVTPVGADGVTHHPPTAPVTLHLTMTPGAAAGDVPTGTRDCYASEESSAAPGDCAFGDSHGSRTVALVGDSHAQALFPAMDRLAEQRHWRLLVWTKPACPMIHLQVTLPQFDDAYPTCGPWQTHVLSRLAAVPHLAAVVVAGYAGVASIPDRFRTAAGTRVTTATFDPVWRAAWAVTDTQLGRVADRVVIVSDTPEPATDVPDCLDEHVSAESACAIPRTAGLRDAHEVTTDERAVSGPTTSVISLTGALCLPTVCPVVTPQGLIAYRDDEHLTAAVSAELAPDIGTQLTAVPGLAAGG